MNKEHPKTQFAGVPWTKEHNVSNVQKMHNLFDFLELSVIADHYSMNASKAGLFGAALGVEIT